MIVGQVNSAEIQNRDRRHFVHPWEDLQTYGSETRTIATRAEGIYVFDEQGNRLIDGPGGMWCVQIGYGRKDMAEAIYHQALDMVYNSPWGLTNGPAACLAKKIADLAPGDLNHVFFTTGGSTAVDSALRFVMFYNNTLGRAEKKLIISRQDAYHGSTYLSGSCSGKEQDKVHLDFADTLVHHISSPNPYCRPDGVSEEDFNDQLLQELEHKILELGPQRVAAFIAEPILASGGVIVPPRGYHRRCLELCRKYDVLYISDEVVTGFGRLGYWFASKDVFGIQPDIITCAKGLTSGYQPLGACLLSDRLLSQIGETADSEAVFSNGFTYSGHPVACAAAMKNIEIIENEGILEHVQEVSPHFQESLGRLADLPIVGEVRGEGLMACVECTISKEHRHPSLLDKEIGQRIDRHCQDLGLLVRPISHMNVISPPLIITRRQIDEVADKLRTGIKRTMQDLRSEGLWTG